MTAPSDDRSLALEATADRMIARAEAMAAELAAARQRIAELEAAREWRPIETAPKDGTVVMLFRRVGYWDVLGHGHWVDVRGISGWICHPLRDPPGALGLGSPTHWMPLPAPPVTP